MKRARARAARTITMAMRGMGNKESKEGKVMAMATRIAGKCTVMAMERVMVTAMRVVGV